jgi:O-antigen ligase
LTAPVPPRPGGGDPALPLGVALALAPVAVVLQSKALAPIATAALLAAVLLHRRRHGAWPWPEGAAFWAALALLAWAAVTAAWAPEPPRALLTSVQIGGFIALGAAAARAVAAAEAAARARLMRLAALGLGLGLAAAAFDAATGHALRAGVRGLSEVPPTLAYGLKPAASAMALWLPLVAAAPLPRWLRGAILAAGALVLLALPGESPKLAVLAAAAAAGLAWLAPRHGVRALGLAAAAAVLLMPLLLGPVLARGVPAGGLPASAAHRLMIWDFTATRIAERPLSGWGMEASRAIPGHDLPAGEARLARFGLTHPGVEPWLAQAQMLPLHPHNGALQLWLELGLPGAALGALMVALLGLAAARAPRPGVAVAMLASGLVTALLSFGAWQEWWVGAQLLAVAAAAGLPGSGPTRIAEGRHRGEA